MKEATLLNELLQLLDAGGVHSTVELARQLNVSEGLFAAMADDLVRHGYLTPIAAGCGTSCSDCWARRSRTVETCALARGLEAAESCNRPNTTSPMLALTTKGRQAARRPRQ